MTSETRNEFPHRFLSCHWPQEFKSRRPFPRQIENEPFIEYCQRQQFPRQKDNQTPIKHLSYPSDENGDDGSVGGSDAGESDSGETDESEGDESEDDSEEDEDDDGVGEEQSQYGDQKKEKGENQSHQTGDNNVEAWNSRSAIRRFMEGFIGDEETLPYPDQVEKVVGFCERGSSTESKKHVALLNDTNDGGNGPEKRPYCRPYKGPLTSQKFRGELEKKRYKTKSDPNNTPPRLDYERDDAERRVVFITDLDPSTIEALAATVPRLQAPATRNMLYKNLTGKPAMGANISTKDLRVFTLECHITYFILKKSERLITDVRKTIEGKPLRQSWKLPFLSGPMSASASDTELLCLYEAQTSLVVTGIDSRVWTAYCIVDTYFGSNESLQHYHEENGPSAQVDPLAAGQIPAIPSITLIWAPREYFSKIVAIRMNEARRAWRQIIDEVEGSVKQVQTNHIIPKSSNDASRQAARNYSDWCTQMVALLRRLRNRLSDTVAAWDEFRGGEIGYFNDGESTAVFSPLKNSMGDVNKAFSDLKEILRKLRDLERELCEDSPQGVHAHLNFGNQDVAIVQQRAARHMQVLTIVTIVFFPFLLASALFSTQGVLPFTPNVEKFIVSLIILAALVIVTFIVLLKWELWFQPFLERFLWRIGCMDLPQQWDLEKGPEKKKIT
ncbi:hypothetical protein L207DRAFT_627873 [Hyaloscypha variabilis F]|uniref:Cora-domain-containing protein n=1 Tax=Hyaloscypha variabilis (strain UAMH 11265 / GT02V1 / F) TaxID=1149755 RepID=A0A2J6S8T0_HYAVF|nr:hypothetical protein L207DRAFT_627873 [Hyaloscypha variabilis F]